MNDKKRLYDELSALLTDYEGNGSDSKPTAEDFYDFLVRLQRNWETLNEVTDDE
jgi:hypothetical protein